MFQILARVGLAHGMKGLMCLSGKRHSSKEEVYAVGYVHEEEMFLETFIVLIIPSKSIMAAFIRQLLSWKPLLASPWAIS